MCIHRISIQHNKSWTHFLQQTFKEMFKLRNDDSRKIRIFKNHKKFEISSKFFLHPVASTNNKQCIGFSRTSFTSIECVFLRRPLNALVCHYETKRISDGVQCLEARDNNFTRASHCTRSDRQQWLSETPKHQELKNEEESQPLAEQRH